MQLGSHYLGDRQCQFTLWAPLLQQVAVHITAPTPQLIPLQPIGRGYWQGTIAAEPGTQYFYQLDGEVDRPDPASQLQPLGVHGASEVVDPAAYGWGDRDWTGLPWKQYVIYELHVGTFTPEGTFEAMIPRLAELKALGITAIELMPVCQFPGTRNWGYDGVYPYAVQHSYGGVAGLKQLVDACHQQGMAVILDVVYNHLGPEGNYLWGLGTYFTERYKTPWGSAVNYDDAYSDGVREYFVQNVRYWFEQFHIDALRLDAVHAIYDFGAKHILQEMAEATAQLAQQQGRSLYLIAESDLNDPRLLRAGDQGGYGLDAQWNDDFHHALHTLLTGENQGYYEDYGALHHLAKAYQENFVYTWNYSPHRKRLHGAPAPDCSPSQFVVFSQNHDQVGNRMEGDRLCRLVDFESQKLAAAAVLLSPSIPMLFMGEEYGEKSPFLFFIDHGDANLVEAVRSGRKAEFAAFHAAGEPPDPQSVETFERSQLHWDDRHQGQSGRLWSFYQSLIQFRSNHSVFLNPNRANIEAIALESEKVLKLRLWQQNEQIFCLFNFSTTATPIKVTLPPGTWKIALNSADPIWGGSGANIPEIIPTERSGAVPQQELNLYPKAVVVYQRMS
ncbi:MAG: malto-oligosyltrehalose trehalohydrolase [Oculatellaceae cyanobacterium Prado106]|jgi:maltooligosyltrehalose trehalohydrolase|nr:malto-oligosyltrehalose trehalohydrolase [Oculatellaceae cyanobacterium Prado106]